MEDKAIMQVLTKRYPKNCLLTVMDRYLAVVRNMEQVVMIPSLLQDMQPSTHGYQAQTGASDLYSYFTMLKAIRMDVSTGCCPGRSGRPSWQVAKPMELRLKLERWKRLRKRGYWGTWTWKPSSTCTPR